MTTPARYWREIPQRYRLEAAKCTKCGEIFFPPRLICSKCGHKEFENINLPDTGKIITYTVIRVAPSQFVDQAPFAIGIVELENGVRITCQIVDCDLEKLGTGQKVKIEFRKIQSNSKASVICYGYKAVLA